MAPKATRLAVQAVLLAMVVLAAVGAPQLAVFGGLALAALVGVLGTRLERGRDDAEG